MTAARSIVLAVTLFAVSTASAQESFVDLDVKVGDLVRVEYPDGKSFIARLTDLAPTRLLVDGQVVTPGAGLIIERVGDPLWDGPVLGAVIGFAVGAVLVNGQCGVKRPAWKCMVGPAVLGSAIGLTVDWRRKKRVRVYPKSVP